MLAAVESHHDQSVEIPDVFRFWKQAAEEAASTLVSLPGPDLMKEVAKQSLCSLSEVLALVESKDVDLTFTPDLLSAAFTTGAAGDEVLGSWLPAEGFGSYSFQPYCAPDKAAGTFKIGIKTIGDSFFAKWGVHTNCLRGGQHHHGPAEEVRPHRHTVRPWPWDAPR